MPERVWHTEQWLGLFTALGVLAAAGRALAIFGQIRDALHASNIYLADKDIGEAFDQIVAVQQKFKDPDSKLDRQGLKDDLTRVVFRFDGVFRAIDDLNTNGGFGAGNWTRLLQYLCPQLSQYSYVVAGNATPSAKMICEREQNVWRPKSNETRGLDPSGGGGGGGGRYPWTVYRRG
jgi:hypothetical protein